MMKLKSFVTSVVLSIALVLFFRYSISPYMGLYIFKVNEASAWISGVATLLVIKSVQLSPLACRLDWLIGIRYEWCMALACLAYPIDFLIMLKGHEAGDIGGLVQLIGSMGWTAMVRLLALQWVRVPVVMTPSIEVVRPMREPATVYPQTRQQQAYRPVSEPVSHGTRSTQSDSQFVSQLIPRISSLFVVGLSGSGKDFTTSVLADHCRQKHNAKIFYIDPKKSDNEANLWESVADYSYSFKGVPMPPDEYLEHLKTAFAQYMDRLESNGGEYYTILVLNELATCATKVDNSKDKKWLAATLQPMISGLDSEGGAVWVLTQTTSMPAGFSNGVVSQFQKLIICRENQIENLTTQNQNTLMKGVDLEGVGSRCKESEIDRAIYSSSLMKWLSLPALRKGQSYYDRDARRWVGTPPESGTRSKNSENGADLYVAQQENAGFSPIAPHDPTASDARSDAIISALTDYFDSVDPDPKPIGKVRGSRRMTNIKASTAEIESALDKLVATGYLLKLPDGWALPD